jgi:hypothetical protein
VHTYAMGERPMIGTKCLCIAELGTSATVEGVDTGSNPVTEGAENTLRLIAQWIERCLTRWRLGFESQLRPWQVVCRKALIQGPGSRVAESPLRDGGYTPP